MVIITDTREQKPMWVTNRATLKVGDYTTKKLHGKYHVERKSLQDLYGTLTKGNSRFKYELFRAAFHQIRIDVYVEGTRDSFINKKFPGGADRKFSSEGLDRLIKTFEGKYFLKFHWFLNRKKCQLAIENRLKQEENAVLKIIRK